MLLKQFTFTFRIFQLFLEGKTDTSRKKQGSDEQNLQIHGYGNFEPYQ